MKRRNSLLAVAGLAVLAAAACSSEMTAQRVKIEIPAIPKIKTPEISEIVLAPFWLEREVPGVDMNKDLAEYLIDQLRPKFSGRISAKPVAWTGPEMAADPEVWKRAALGPAGALVLTGKAAFSQESRKALLATDKKKFEDPFEPEKKWAERKTFVLKLDVLVLKAETGTVFYQGVFQESLNYENTKQPAAFAFHDLLDRIKPRLFRAVFGSERIQERVLLLK
jgi:hypothetical protein